MKKSVLFSFLILIMLSCEIEDSADNNRNDTRIIPVNCEKLKNGLRNQNGDSVAVEINKLLVGLYPSPITEDLLGHKKNFDTLIHRINSQCSDLHAELLCYGCIETLPLQSEIVIEIEYSGFSIYKIIDIATPEEDSLSFGGVHEYYTGTGTLKGTIGIYEGNCMPGPGVPPCVPSPLSTTVFITEPSEDFSFGLLVDSTISDEEGNYQLNLQEGYYSIFLRDTASIVCELWSCPYGDCFCNPFRITNDSVTIMDVNIDHAVW